MQAFATKANLELENATIGARKKKEEKLLSQLDVFKKATKTPAWLKKLQKCGKILGIAEDFADLTGASFESVLERFEITEV